MVHCDIAVVHIWQAASLSSKIEASADFRCGQKDSTYGHRVIKRCVKAMASSSLQDGSVYGLETLLNLEAAHLWQWQSSCVSGLDRTA